MKRILSLSVVALTVLALGVPMGHLAGIGMNRSGSTVMAATKKATKKTTKKATKKKTAKKAKKKAGKRKATKRKAKKAKRKTTKKKAAKRRKAGSRKAKKRSRRCTVAADGQECIGRCTNSDLECVPTEVECIPGGTCRITDCGCVDETLCHAEVSTVEGFEVQCAGDCVEGDLQCTTIVTEATDDNGSVIELITCDCDMPPPPQLPDLIISITAPTWVSCPEGPGSCVHTVELLVTNDSDVPVVGTFAVEVTTNDLVGGATLNGLAAYGQQPLTVTTGPGDNCYDPDCLVTATVDSNDEIAESDETNNTDSREDAG